MARGKRTVRASEIGSFVYCQRAWWYQRQNKLPINQKELADGTNYHKEHTNKARAIGILQIAAWLFLFLALAFLTVYFGLRTFG
jgi:hypothetical protein